MGIWSCCEERSAKMLLSPSVSYSKLSMPSTTNQVDPGGNLRERHFPLHLLLNLQHKSHLQENQGN